MFLAPAVLPVTFNVMVQLAPGASDAPVIPTAPDPAVMLLLSLPQEVGLRPLEVATARPVGKVSVKLMPFTVTVFVEGLVTTKVSVLVPPARMVEGTKLLLMVGGATPVPDKLTLWGLPLALSLMVTEPDNEPGAVGVNVTSIVQVAASATVPPL